MIEANLAIRIPAAVTDPSTEIVSEARHVPAREIFRILESRYLSGETGCEFFIGVDRKEPVVLRNRSCEVFLARVAAPRFVHHARSEFGSNLACPIRRPAIHHNDFI